MFRKKARIIAPIDGKVMNLEEINDTVFAKKMLGDGIGILYTGGDVVAPFDGVITAIIASNHAIGITDKKGVELIIHIGIDTVKLNEKNPFNCCVALNQSVQSGQTLIKIDYEKLIEANCDVSSPIIVSNTNGRMVAPCKKSGDLVTGGRDVIFTY